MFSLLYKGEELNKVNSFFKTTLGMGNILGLFFGTFLYIYGGYTLPFLVYGIAHLGISPMIFVLIPAEMDDYKA